MAGLNTPTALGTENIGKLLMQYAVPAIIPSVLLTGDVVSIEKIFPA